MPTITTPNKDKHKHKLATQQEPQSKAGVELRVSCILCLTQAVHAHVDAIETDAKIHVA
jgi:hypothetical protein